ncbi:MAG: NADH-quinone oxidoreductase subunit NuoB [Acidilobaceae archaeon]
MIYVGVLEAAYRRALEILSGKLRIGQVADWFTAYSLWPVHLVTGCCGAEFAAAYGPLVDCEQYGSLPWVSPRQTNLIVIEGTVTRKMACALKITYEQMPPPKYVIAMGACAIDYGVFRGSYNMVKPWEVVPVDIFVPGCPPTPEALARAIVELQRKIKRGEVAAKTGALLSEAKADPCRWWSP